MNDLSRKASLSDIMSAMDVVDTLRHQQDLVARELDSDRREQQLLDRLRKIYQGQGLDVPDHILKEGIQALEDDRFKYKPHNDSKLAQLYVSRSSWGKPLAALMLIIIFVSCGYYFTQVRPADQARRAIPVALVDTFNAIQTAAKDPAIIATAYQTREAAETAYANKQFSQAQNLQQELKNTLNLLQQTFKIRIVSRPNESSGIWRVTEINSNNRNYYLIVEAINQQNQAIALPILNEENNRRKTVKKWGLRVDRSTFNQVANDKRDDGIIQNNIVGEKRYGVLKPTYSINTNGQSITDW